jgi:hypothetical protein
VIVDNTRLDPGELFVGSISISRCRYLEKSRMTAILQHCPARLVPPPDQ